MGNERKRESGKETRALGLRFGVWGSGFGFEEGRIGIRASLGLTLRSGDRISGEIIQ